MLRKALQRAQQKVHDCDVAQSINGGQQVPGVVRANAKASAAWGVLMSRIEKHNSTSIFLESMDSSSAAPAAAAKKGLLQTMMDAVRQVKRDERASKEVKLARAHSRLFALHQILGQKLGLGEQYEIYKFNAATRAPAHEYVSALDTLDSSIAALKQEAAHKKRRSSFRPTLSTSDTANVNGWGQSHWVGPRSQRPNWH